MIEPNRLSNPGERAARDRVEAIYAAVDRLTPDDLAVPSAVPVDPEAREVLLADLERVADAHGRGELLDEARGWLRDALLSRAVSRYRLETGVAGIPAAGRPEDQVRVLVALEDAVTVAVAEDLLDPDDAALLAGPGRAILGLPVPGRSGSARADPPWAPSAREWAEAERQAEAGSDEEDAGQPDRVDRDALLPGVHGMWVAFLAVAAVVGVLAGLAWGLTQEDPWIGALVAIAAIGLAWTLATFRRAR